MSKTMGCLVLHGFGGDVREVMPLARHLQQQGYTVECPTLEGHGQGRRHFGRSTRQQWVQSAEEAYKRLAMRADHIIIIGFSMGGLLAFQITNRHPVSMVITLNTPYIYWDFRQIIHYLREDFRTYSMKYMRSMATPFRCLLQFRKLLAETKLLLPSITCPYHIIQGNRDDTVQAISAEHLRRSVGSQGVTITYFENSGHQLFLDKEANQVIHKVSELVEEHVASCQMV